MRERFYRVAAQLLDSDPRVAVVLADIGVSGLGVYGVFERHPQRAINVGIREALMVSAAAGMALEGMRPIVHSYTPFLIERAFEQIKLDFGHQGAGGILVSIGASYDASEEGRTHQAPEDVALIELRCPVGRSTCRVIPMRSSICYAQRRPATTLSTSDSRTRRIPTRTAWTRATGPR